MKNFTFGLLLCLCMFGANCCFADFIVVGPVNSPLTTLSGNPNFTKERVTTNLSSAVAGLEHDETYYSNAWVAELQTSTPANNYLEYSFTDPTAQLVEQISFWNLTDVSAVFLAGGAFEDTSIDPTLWNRDSGVKDIKLYRSENGGSSWIDIGSFTLSQTLTTDTYNDATYGNLFFAREQQILFTTPFLANAMKVEILTNYGNGTKVGLAEVNFFSPSAVPEPASLLLFGGAIVVAGTCKRLRRRRTMTDAPSAV